MNPKSQSAFIEAMSERQATIDGITMPLPIPFFVIATQNPFEFEGTFPLIEAQRDRFMLSIKSSYLNFDDELSIIRRVHANQLDWDSYSRTIKPLLSPETIRQYVGVVGNITVEERSSPISGTLSLQHGRILRSTWVHRPVPRLPLSVAGRAWRRSGTGPT